MATPQVKDLVLRSPAGSSEVLTFTWPLQVGTGQDKHDNGIDIIDTIKYVCDELPSISSAFDEIKFHEIDTACYKTMTNLVDRFNKAVDSIVALEKGTSLPAERLNKFANPCLLRHILQLVYNAAVLDPDKLNNYEPFSPEVYGETSYELVQQMIKHVTITGDDTFVDLGSGVGQVVLQMAGSFPLKACIGVEKADTPARYAERMDMFFRQFMAWFGKRYCDYKLIKGDFLVDEHREKITSSTLVFVNNFAFGPNVDHQLKERFADLRDGARVVSSKSFCPLNFRITDRNLSDIGTIMHVSEIPPLKGSVSWTCKPVSYYLHVIDRTILERYFQRVKTQKGSENDHTGKWSTRTTRDRAKREANSNSQNSNQNSNSNSSFTLNTLIRTNSPANAQGVNTTTSKTTRQQQQQREREQQRNMADMDTSTESDNETNNGNSNGPMTRKVWSDWCSSSKGKSSQSDDEELNNNNNNTNNHNKARTAVRALSTTTTTMQTNQITITNNAQKKRKKLTRKAAIASKSAAAAARQREEAVIAAEAKETALKEDGNSSTATTTLQTNNGAGNAKGRKKGVKKGAGGGGGGPRGRKSLKIVGLDVLHKKTLLSTAGEDVNKKLPAAPGCVDQHLTSLLTRTMSHTEFDIPESPQNTPYALQILLDLFRTQYMSMIDNMRSTTYVPKIKQQIKMEQERMQRIKNRASQLEKQIRVLIDDSVALLKIRMNELGINVSSPNDLIAKAKEIVGRHKELQCMAKRIQSQVTTCEIEQKRMLRKQLLHLPEYQKLYGSNGKTKLELPGHELSEAAAHELVLREIANTLSQRKKLYAQVSNIEKEAASLEKAAEERRTAAALLAQGTNMTLATPAATQQQHSTGQVATLTLLQQPLQLTTNGSNSNSNIVVVPAGKSANSTSATQASVTAPNSKSSRRSRDHRTRSQEWPDVPDVGKIEESNPEVLAQKILETGRQIEAGKFASGNATFEHVVSGSNHNSKHLPQNEEKRASRSGPSSRSSSGERAGLGSHQPVYLLGPQDSTLMPAPIASKQQQQQQQQQPVNCTRSGLSILPKCDLPGRKTSATAAHNTVNLSSVQESPKVANFEDRLKSIITSALNEDQEHRKSVSHQNIEVIPTPKRSKQASAAALASASSSTSLTSSSSASVATLTPINPSPQQQNHLNSTASIPQNLSNLITVATQGLTHLNANTTISPITPPLTQTTQLAATAAALPYGSKYKHASNAVATNSAHQSQTQKYNKSKDSSFGKYHQSPHHHHPQQQSPHRQQHSTYVTPPQSVSANIESASSHNCRRRSSVSASNFEQFQQQQQSQHIHNQQQQQQQQQHQAYIMGAATSSALAPPLHGLEFKAPPTSAGNNSSNSNNSNHNEYHHQQRSGSREQLMLLAAASEIDAPSRSSSVHSADGGTPSSSSSVMYYPPTRERLVSLERESTATHGVLQNVDVGHQSRPNSNCSQPDYTQVSPAKMALRRHLSQEKINQQIPCSNSSSNNNSITPMSTKTIGDLVNGEIERTLEISHQSIINAVVNMSTVGVNTAVDRERERDRYMLERQHDQQQQQQQHQQPQRLLINPNAQRPERVHVRVLDESTTHDSSYHDSTRSKSPLGSQHNNLATLAHVAAYNQKSSSGGLIIEANAANKCNNTRQQYNVSGRDIQQSSSSYQHHQNVGRSNTGGCNAATISPRSVVGSQSRQSIDYQTVALPRAEMKGCIEAYFNDEHHQQRQQQQQQQQQPMSLHKVNTTPTHKERVAGVRSGRLNNGNPPLEGLAASLQDHVMASRKFKEENERRAASSNSNSNSNNIDHQHQHAHIYPIVSHQHHYQNHNNINSGVPGVATTTPVKVEIGVKRTSPMSTTNQPRPTKIPHYALHEQQTLQQHHNHNNINAPQQTLNPYANTNGIGNYVGNNVSPMKNSQNPSITHNNVQHYHQHQQHEQQQQQQQQMQYIRQQRNKLPIEPLLMSPEINSAVSDEQRRHQEQQQQQHHHHHHNLNNNLQQQQQQQQHHHSHVHQHQHQHEQQQQHQQQHQQHMRTTTPLSVASSSGRRSTTANGGADDVDHLAPPLTPSPISVKTPSPKKLPKRRRLRRL